MQQTQSSSTGYNPVGQLPGAAGPITAQTYVSGVTISKTTPAVEQQPLVADGEASETPTTTPKHSDAQDGKAPVGSSGLSERNANRPMSARLWSSVKSTASWMEQGLAEFFGLNESKYEWAIVELEHRKRMEAENAAKQAERETELQEESHSYLSALEEQSSSPARLLPVGRHMDS